MSKQHLKQVSPLTWIYVDEPKTMSNKKQNSIDWLYNTIDYEIVSYLDGEIDLNELSIAMLKIKEQAKAMHQQEIEGAYDREVIGDIQNWYIRNGKHYYELHYKEEQVGE